MTFYTFAPKSHLSDSKGANGDSSTKLPFASKSFYVNENEKARIDSLMEVKLIKTNRPTLTSVLSYLALSLSVVT